MVLSSGVLRFMGSKLRPVHRRPKTQRTMAPEEPTMTKQPPRKPRQRPKPQHHPGGWQPGEEILGEIETEITGPIAHEATARDHRAVILVREAEKRHDPHAIRVENAAGKRIGYLAATVATWLSPLIDQGMLRVEGGLRGNSAAGWEPSTGSRRLVLAIFLRPAGRRLFQKFLAQPGGDAKQAIVCQAYQKALQNPNHNEILQALEHLRPLEQQDLPPETRLLLALLPSIAREAQVAHGIHLIATLHSLLAGITVGQPWYLPPLTLFFLSWPLPQESPYRILSEAIRQGGALVEEITEDGDISRLRVVNRLQVPILIPEGEILVGAKQNRMVNASVLVAAGATFTLPVSCVEQGRWGYQSRQFESAFCAPPSLRLRNARAVRSSRQSHDRPHGDQGEVWTEVAKGLHEAAIASPTSSLADGLRTAQARRRKYWQDLTLPVGAAGMLVARGSRVIGVDLFDSPGTFAAIWDRLADAYYFDVLRNVEPASPAGPENVKPFLRSIVEHARPRASALGLGDELEIASDRLIGAGLMYTGRLCHLATFTRSD